MCSAVGSGQGSGDENPDEIALFSLEDCSKYELWLQKDAWKHLRSVYEQLGWETCSRLADGQIHWLEEQSLLKSANSRVSAESLLWTKH